MTHNNSIKLQRSYSTIIIKIINSYNSRATNSSILLLPLTSSQRKPQSLQPRFSYLKLPYINLIILPCQNNISPVAEIEGGFGIYCNLISGKQVGIYTIYKCVIYFKRNHLIGEVNNSKYYIIFLFSLICINIFSVLNCYGLETTSPGTVI